MLAKNFGFVLFTLASSLIQVCWGLKIHSSRFKQFSHIKTKTPQSVQEQAVIDLITRLIPKHASKFLVIVNSSLGPHSDLDTFEYVTDAKEGKLVITGTTGVAAALGFQHFLKYSCHAHVSWSGDQLKIPEPFPVVHKTVMVTSPNRFRYYQNVCTVSYSFVWWNWTRWEREIDWMAMNGINLPLAFNGQEAIWQKVYLRVGLTQQEIDQHFGGPAFLAWARMGNLRGWGGPLPSSWHTNQLQLQHKILERMRAFGMTPVLPGFAGHVPEGLTRVFPKANVSRLGDWGHFNSTYCCTYLLDPTDTLFKQIGGAFIKAMIAEFGTDHIYNADTFNEMTPGSSEPSYLSSASKAVYDGMLAGDPKAIWLMQGWLFQDTVFWKPPQIKALLQGSAGGKDLSNDTQIKVIGSMEPEICTKMLRNSSEKLKAKFPATICGYSMAKNAHFDDAFSEVFKWEASPVEGVPKGKMIVLDLYAEVSPVWQRTESFYGQPFIWCMLHNFGGNIGFYGNFMSVISGPIDAHGHEGSTMIGTGLTPEGIEQNDVIYELMNEMGWRTEQVDIMSWVKDYSYRRYGGMNNYSLTAWLLLSRSVYNCTDGHADHVHSVIVNRPSLHLKFNQWYMPEDVWQAWDAMVLSADSFNPVEPFRYDLVDVTRQSLQLIAMNIYYEVLSGYHNKSKTEVQAAATKLFQLFTDMDSILSSNQYFLLGHWLNSAKALATNTQEKKLYEYNARNQITLWGPRGNIDDYANKMWGGLVSSYYKPRWQLFVSFLLDAVAHGTPFDSNKFNTAILGQETKWTHDTSSFPDSPVGDTLTIAKQLHAKYRPKK